MKPLAFVSPAAGLALLLWSAAIGVQCSSSSGGGGESKIPNLITPPSGVTVKENAGSVSVAVARVNPEGGAISIDYETADGSAVAPADYIKKSGRLTWSADDKSDRLIVISIVDDDWAESVEQFQLNFFNLVGGAQSRASTTVFILDDETQVPPVDPTQRILFTLDPATGIAAAGDVDGDGTADLIAADPSYQSKRGRVRVFSGKTGSVLYEILGTISEPTGSAASGVGDVDGDGRADFAVAFSTSVWIVRVFSGKDGKQLHEWKGTNAGMPLHVVISGAGDVNADKYTDVIVGLTGFTMVENADPASALVYSGRDGKLLHTLVGDGLGEQFGLAVAGPGDLDGDSFDDVLVGAPNAAVQTTESGAVYAFSGKDGAKISRVPSPETKASFGHSIASAGDINKDGTTDFVVGAPTAFTSAGRAYVFSGKDRKLLRTVVGTRPGVFLGTSVAAAGDADGDSYPDIVVGAPGASSDPGAIDVISGGNGKLLYRFTGLAAAGTGLGRSVSHVGDTNGDGIDEFAIGGQRAVIVVSAAPVALVADTHQISLSAVGRQSLRLQAPKTTNGLFYLVAGSFGTTPGLQIGSVRVPLNPDPWFTLSIALANTNTFRSTRGRISASGAATASIHTPKANEPAAIGLTLYHAFVVFDEKNVFHMASNAVPLTFLK